MDLWKTKQDLQKIEKKKGNRERLEEWKQTASLFGLNLGRAAFHMHGPVLTVDDVARNAERLGVDNPDYYAQNAKRLGIDDLDDPNCYAVKMIRENLEQRSFIPPTGNIFLEQIWPFGYDLYVLREVKHNSKGTTALRMTGRGYFNDHGIIIEYD